MSEQVAHAQSQRTITVTHPQSDEQTHEATIRQAQQALNSSAITFSITVTDGNLGKQEEREAMESAFGKQKERLVLALRNKHFSDAYRQVPPHLPASFEEREGIEGATCSDVSSCWCCPCGGRGDARNGGAGYACRDDRSGDQDANSRR
eukprot:3079712-Rhodomonas_salina.1